MTGYMQAMVKAVLFAASDTMSLYQIGDLFGVSLEPTQNAKGKKEKMIISDACTKGRVTRGNLQFQIHILLRKTHGDG